MKRCVDCVHCYVPYKYHPGELGGWREYHWDRATCKATPDYVTGSGSNNRRCSEERSDSSGCGPEATRFEAKPPSPPRAPRRTLWQRMFG